MAPFAVFLTLHLFFKLNLCIHFKNPMSALPLFSVPPHASVPLFHLWVSPFIALPTAHQVTMGRGASSPTEAIQASPFRGAQLTDRQAEGSGTTPAPVVGGLQ